MNKFLVVAFTLFFAVFANTKYGSSRSSFSSSRSSSFSSSRSSFSSSPSRSYSAPSRSYSAPSAPSRSYSAPTTSYSKPVATPSYGTRPAPSTSYQKQAAPVTYSKPTPTAPVAAPKAVASSAPSSYSKSATYTAPQTVTRTVNNRTVIYRTHYYHSDPYSGSLNSFMMGALVTHMLLDNGRRVEVYSNGNGGAYYMNGNQQIPVQPQSNGQFVQNEEVQPQAVAQAPQVQQVQQTPAPKKDDSWGFWGWIWRLTLATVLLGGVIFIAVLWGAARHEKVENFVGSN